MNLDCLARGHDSIDVYCHQTKASTRAQAEKLPIFSRTAGHRTVSVADGWCKRCAGPGLAGLSPGQHQADAVAVMEIAQLFEAGRTEAVSFIDDHRLALGGEIVLAVRVGLPLARPTIPRNRISRPSRLERTVRGVLVTEGV